MSVLIGGGSGFVGRHLSKLLAENGMKVTWVSRSAGPDKITWNDITRLGLPERYTAVISLSGENILNPMKRWNAEFQEKLRTSRVSCTKILATAITASPDPPDVFISFSGVGYYKPDPYIEYDEYAPGGDFDFLSRLCAEWECVAHLPTCITTRQVIIRSGVVLGRDGGMIQSLYWPFFFGLGGRIGEGTQWFPWIHVTDLVGLVTYAIYNDMVSGVLNGVAPEVITNEQFSKTFATTMKRPALLPIPASVMQTIYGPERAKMILEGQKVIPKRTLETGYGFIFPHINCACKDIAQTLFANSINANR